MPPFLVAWDNRARMSLSSKSDLYRKLPSLDEFVRGPHLAPLIARDGRPAVTNAARVVLERLRHEISTGHLDSSAIDLALAGLVPAMEREIRISLGYALRPVINATGVILHTNLGRAPIARSAIEQIGHAAGRYSN